MTVAAIVLAAVFIPCMGLAFLAGLIVAAFRLPKTLAGMDQGQMDQLAYEVRRLKR